MSGGPEELRADERERFERIDREVVRIRDEHGLPLGCRLREVHADQLWRAGWPDRRAARPSWGAYTLERAGISRRRANYLIAYADLRDEWEPGFPFPPTERHGRPLVRLTAEQRRRVLDDLGGSFDGVNHDRVEEAAATASGRRLPARQREATVAVPGRGPIPLSRTRILEDLATAHAALVRIQRHGANIISDAVEAVPPGRREEVVRHVEESAWVISRFAEAVAFHYDADDGPAQERMAIAT